MQCRVHTGQLGRLYPEFKASNAEIVVILGDTPERARKYAESLKLPFPVLADVDRAVYHQFGLEKALFVIQRTASVIIDQGGVIRYLKQATNPNTWLAESRELLQAAKGLAQNSGTNATKSL